ncbi:hypothetical protein [Mycobacterium deserti]|uniref:Uncharacterized protein n=1 Tax=Mycobacterium deserti TaxID=2978347 RepID=A0ABT2M5L2_9MYCO|nr:hypothetical protein [Mycobacterium deserti]MCT7657537.1 hypothetical protein [Mycobacterium deserti]
MTSIGALGRRSCAALAVCSAGLHTAMLGHAANPVAAGLLVVMIVGCLYCARELWREGSVRAWTVVALMNLAMIALHLPAPAHHHGTVAAAPGQMTAATSVALVEVLIASTVVYVRSRGHWARLSDVADR